MTAAPGARGEAARPGRSERSSAAGRCGGGAEERRGGRGTGRAAGGGGRTSGTFPPCLAHSDSAEVRRAGAANKGAEWGGERVGRGSVPGPLPEDPGGRKPECHLNSARGAGAWDSSAAGFSNNGWSASSKLRESRPGRRTTARPLRPRSWPLETPAVAWRWPGNSRMKSKKGKAHGRRAPWARVPGQRARRAARVTRWTCPPRGLAGLSRGRPLCGSCVWNGRCCFPSRHNTRGCCGETGLSTLLARCQEARSAPCLCASKFHCLHTDTPRSAEPPRGFSRAGEWGPELGGTPAPLFSVGPGVARPAALCLKVGLRGSPLAPGRVRARLFPGWGVSPSEERDSGPPIAPGGVGPFEKVKFFPEFLASQKFSHDEFGARGRVRTEGVQ